MIDRDHAGFDRATLLARACAGTWTQVVLSSSHGSPDCAHISSGSVFPVHCHVPSTPTAQSSMLTATPCEALYQLHTDHSPFFSQPRRLHRVLTAIAGA